MNKSVSYQKFITRYMKAKFSNNAMGIYIKDLHIVKDLKDFIIKHKSEFNIKVKNDNIQFKPIGYLYFKESIMKVEKGKIIRKVK